MLAANQIKERFVPGLVGVALLLALFVNVITKRNMCHDTGRSFEAAQIASGASPSSPRGVLKYLHRDMLRCGISQGTRSVTRVFLRLTPLTAGALGFFLLIWSGERPSF